MFLPPVIKTVSLSYIDSYIFITKKGLIIINKLIFFKNKRICIIKQIPGRK